VDQLGNKADLTPSPL